MPLQTNQITQDTNVQLPSTSGKLRSEFPGKSLEDLPGGGRGAFTGSSLSHEVTAWVSLAPGSWIPQSTAPIPTPTIPVAGFTKIALYETSQSTVATVPFLSLCFNTEEEEMKKETLWEQWSQQHL